jgi:hypothetical protein
VPVAVDGVGGADDRDLVSREEVARGLLDFVFSDAVVEGEVAAFGEAGVEPVEVGSGAVVAVVAVDEE